MPHEKVEVPVKALTNGPAHHYFGYYDKFPWDATGRFVACLETCFMDRPPQPEDRAVIGLIDLEGGGEWQPVAETRAWNWQQGTMLQWNPAAPSCEIVYNGQDEERFGAVVQDVRTGEKRSLPRPVYALSRNGSCAASVNFSRIHDCRPGYGYAGPSDPWQEDLAPEDDGIYWMDMSTGETRLIVSIARVAALDPTPTMEGAKHYFNHLQFNTDDSRIEFLHRWRRGESWETRMFTVSPNGADLFCVAADRMVSHFDWRDPEHILAWARQEGRGDHFYLFTDRSGKAEKVGADVLPCDGHCSYSPDRRWILTDTYPGADNNRVLILYGPEDNLRVDIGAFYSPPELQGQIRCDLHPRWSRDGTEVCFDSAHEGTRQLYVADVNEVVSD